MARFLLASLCLILGIGVCRSLEFNGHNPYFFEDSVFLWNVTLESSEQAVEFFQQHISVYGELTAPGAERDICFYYKLPMALFTGGAWREANAVMDFIKLNFLQEDGDLRTSPELKTSSFALNEYYPYTNGWVLIAALRMERFDIVRPMYAYMKKYFDGFPTNGPTEDGNTNTDMFSAAHFGLVSLYMNDMKTAKKAAQTILKILRKQPDLDDGMYLRMTGDGQLITEFDAGMAGFYVVNKTAEYQLHFMEGYPALFLIRLYEATNNDCYMDAAKAIISWARECNSQMYQFHYTHKLGVAMSLLYRYTEDRDLLLDIDRVAALLKISQNADGTYLSYDDNSYADIYDQSAEIAVWMRAMDANDYYKIDINDEATKPVTPLTPP
ncbi:hypothetical protein CAPTEDRAFT_219033 [Capitella teleta]|uniref:Alpha-macroglobulin-like TED domain-containing protein n=1 Tax=Capitella teleta TaxID=283909 RepID=R7TJD9_CAPTE|nr:hypothetical protein CAPTEDRAFT_219033 [Capitella teleta]|eukprot:ELT91666.1 hypothetical protein CAPTEDRAFT_219033 [Capitella teleta]